MYDTPLTIEQNLVMLADTPSRLTDLTEGLSPAQLLTPPGPGEWSARDVLVHLRACAEVWGDCIAVILKEDHPTFKALSPRTWIKQTDYLEQEFTPSLQAFAAQRTDLLAVLEALPPDAWSRIALVTGARSRRERSVRTYAQWLANHERSHFRQFERIAAALSL